ncbi:MAG: glycoside hydrolase domain-containing protein [Bacteroidales bacterium]
MKTIILISTALILSLFQFYGQDISYGTGQWNPEGLGNHRAVIYVEKSSDAVKVVVPWRRLDNVDDKNLILIDALTNLRVKNIYSTQKNNEFGEIVFQPISGEGNYYLYYMPGRNTGKSWFPDATYEKPADTYDPAWKNSTANKIDSQLAKIISFESKSDYHSFYPMEIPVTQNELKELLNKNQDKEFLIFPENRNFPARMVETIPYRWFKKGANNAFEGSAMKDESYSWQLGIFAPFKELDNLKLTFYDLKSEKGDILSSKSFKCINMGGNDHLGNKFVKNVKVPKGEVRSMWIVSDIKANQAPGVYLGKVAVSAKGTKSYVIDVKLQIENKIAENRGYNTPQNQSRLNWLDSNIGIDNEVVAPYTPVKLSGRNISIFGRKLSFNKSGFPEKITTSFTGSNHSIDGPDKNILSGSIHLDLLQKGKLIKFSSKEPEIILQKSGAVVWQTVLSSEDIEITIKAKMECDGYINYETKIKAKKDINLDDVQLVLPYEKSTAKYLMGMGKQGGYTPEKLEWKWNQEYANNMIWLGDVNAGLQVKLKHLIPDWKLASFEKVGPYRDWSNEGKGGCNVASTEKEVIVTAYVGAKSMKKDDVMVLNFGLLITPFKTLDDKHWNEKYYHADNNPVTAAKNGATIMNIHHANVYNPYINYPFLSGDTLKSIIDKGKILNIRTKLYYTVRELSTNACELWAMRHLDDEIYSRTNVLVLADTHEKRDPNSIYGMTGHSWLFEHLRTNYDPAWHDRSVGPDWDMSIRTQGLSRWHNYYIEGLNFLIRNYGVRGLYLDGVGYDREIMKRMRKTMDRAADSCLMDFHSGNAFQPAYGLNSPANDCMEVFPYVNSLWLGEMYDYKTTKPDYWIVEISGIPLGLYGEMLDGCGNPYRGMVYGMSTRYYSGCKPMNMWKLWNYFGMSGSEYIGYWDDANPIKTGNNDLLASVYLKKDKAMIAIGNWSDTHQVISLDVDWKKLGMNPASAKVEIPNIDDLQTAGEANVKQLSIPASKGLILIISR